MVVAVAMTGGELGVSAGAQAARIETIKISGQTSLFVMGPP
jgi:hypothetical protein